MRAQIVEQQHLENPISFKLPDGRSFRVWLASKRNKDGSYAKLIGDDLHWRLVAMAAGLDH